MLRFPELTEGRLLRRYKRFLADVELRTGEQVTAFVPNTGSLLGCVDAGIEVWLRPTPDTAKYRYCMTLVRTGSCLVCVDTSIPNSVVASHARGQLIPQLAGYREYIREVPYGESCRADIVCRVHETDMLGRCWVEVKATTLNRDGVACFPDCVTLRGRKHLVEMRKLLEQGDRVAQVFFVQRDDCGSFEPAKDIDPRYAEELGKSARAGVEIIALEGEITKRGIGIKRQLPVEI